MQHKETQKENSIYYFYYISPGVVTCVYQPALASADSLAVFLGQSQGQAEEELVHGNMGLRGEVTREHGGDDHQEAVGQELRTEKKLMITIKLILL